jgi:predicted Zn-dependent protease
MLTAKQMWTGGRASASFLLRDPFRLYRPLRKLRVAILSVAAILCFAFASTCGAQSVQTEDGGAQQKEDPNTAYAQGVAALQAGDLAGARRSFEHVVKIAPNSGAAHNSLGWVLLAQDDIGPAISQLQTAVKLEPGFAQARINLSNAYVRNGDAPLGLHEAREAVKLAPEDSEAQRTLARAEIFSGNADAGIAAFHRAGTGTRAAL